MKRILIEDLFVSKDVKLEDLETKSSIVYSDQEVESKLKKYVKKISKLQEKLYAESKYSVLICLQGMDAAGKDSLIRKVMSGINPQGIKVHSFKSPSTIELKHDYLWRHYMALPARGMMAVFNRSHYENVLVTRVHPEYLKKENNPEIKEVNLAFWENRFKQINNFESHLVENGTIVLKFFLNVSKKEQKTRILARINEPDKNWKFDPRDVKERALWDAYQNAYEQVLKNTSSQKSPWYAIPADDKPMARLMVAKTIYRCLKQYDFQEPIVDLETKNSLEQYKIQLNEE